jgi:hypothetical protein
MPVFAWVGQITLDSDKLTVNFNFIFILRELQGVGDEIEKQLLESSLVRINDVLFLMFLGCEIIEMAFDRYSHYFGLKLEDKDYFICGLFNIEIVAVFSEFSRLNLVEIQDVIDKESQNFGAGILDIDASSILLKDWHQLAEKVFL